MIINEMFNQQIIDDLVKELCRSVITMVEKCIALHLLVVAISLACLCNLSYRSLSLIFTKNIYVNEHERL